MILMLLTSGAYLGSHSTLNQRARVAFAGKADFLLWMGPFSGTMTTGLWHWPGLGPQ